MTKRFNVRVPGIKVEEVSPDGRVSKHHNIKGVSFSRMGPFKMHAYQRLAASTGVVMAAISNPALSEEDVAEFIDGFETAGVDYMNKFMDHKKKQKK